MTSPSQSSGNAAPAPDLDLGEAIEKEQFARTIPIPTLGVGTTEFDITRERALALYESGRKATEEFLKDWDFERYVAEFRQGSDGRKASTTMAFVRMLAKLLRDKELGELVVPIVPDEARTFGMEALFRQAGRVDAGHCAGRAPTHLAEQIVSLPLLCQDPQ